MNCFVYDNFALNMLKESGSTVFLSFQIDRPKEIVQT